MDPIQNTQVNNLINAYKSENSILAKQNIKLEEQNKNLYGAVQYQDSIIHRQQNQTVLTKSNFIFAAVAGAIADTTYAVLSKLKFNNNAGSLKENLANQIKAVENPGGKLLNTALKGAGNWILSFAVIGFIFNGIESMIHKHSK